LEGFPLQKALLTLLAILCFIFLLLGNFYWKERTDVSAYQSTNETGIVEAKENNKVISEEKNIEDKTTSIISQWPANAQEAFSQAREANKPYKLALVGSTAMGTEEDGWAAQLKLALKSAYGVALEVKLFAYDTTSIEFINSNMSQEVLDYAPDLILYEPFTLNDNSGSVAVTDNHDSIEIFLSNLKEANENAVLLLQPTHPIYGATFYPGQVEELQTFASELGVTYLNHWKAWPSYEDEALKEYVTESQGDPSAKGHEVWAGYLEEYFISK
jgi:hypothetical protein